MWTNAGRLWFIALSLKQIWRQRNLKDFLAQTRMFWLCFYWPCFCLSRCFVKWKYNNEPKKEHAKTKWNQCKNFYLSSLGNKCVGRCIQPYSSHTQSICHPMTVRQISLLQVSCVQWWLEQNALFIIVYLWAQIKISIFSIIHDKRVKKQQIIAGWVARTDSLRLVDQYLESIQCFSICKLTTISWVNRTVYISDSQTVRPLIKYSIYNSALEC